MKLNPVPINALDRRYWKKQLGCWGQAIKKYGTSTDEAWDQDDMTSTVEALWDTGQNLYIYPIDTVDDYQYFLELLNEPDAASLSIYASMLSWTTVSTGNIWFDVPLPFLSDPGFSPWGFEKLPLLWEAGTPPSECTGHGKSRWESEAAFKAKWVGAWTLAATFLSRLSVTYPNLKGFVIDDFAKLVESADRPSCCFGDRLTHSEVQAIYEAAHSCNESFEFVPAGYYTGLGRILGDGYVLGANYGVQLKEESMGVTLSFELEEPPLLAVLSSEVTAPCTVRMVCKVF